MLPNVRISLVLATQAVSYKRRVLYLPLRICNFHYIEDLSLGHLINICKICKPAKLQSAMTEESCSSKINELHVSVQTAFLVQFHEKAI
jgi:hypothetical protein